MWYEYVAYWSMNYHMKLSAVECVMTLSIIEVWIITLSYQLMYCGMWYEDVGYWSVNYHMKLSANGLWNVSWRYRLLKCELSLEVIN